MLIWVKVLAEEWSSTLYIAFAYFKMVSLYYRVAMQRSIVATTIDFQNRIAHSFCWDDGLVHSTLAMKIGPLWRIIFPLQLIEQKQYFDAAVLWERCGGIDSQLTLLSSNRKGKICAHLFGKEIDHYSATFFANTVETELIRNEAHLRDPDEKEESYPR